MRKVFLNWRSIVEGQIREQEEAIKSNLRENVRRKALADELRRVIKSAEKLEKKKQ